MTPDWIHAALCAKANTADWTELWAAVDNLLCLHQPQWVDSLNTLNCPEHSVRDNREGFMRAERESRSDRNHTVYKDCPSCIVTQVVSCTGWGCCSWPCKDIEAIAGAFGMLAALRDTPKDD